MCIYPDGYWRDFVMLTYTFPCMYSIISYWIKGLTCIFLKTQYPSSLEPRTFSKWEFGVSRSGVKYMRCISGSSWILATKVLLTYLLIASSIWTFCTCICTSTCQAAFAYVRKLYYIQINWGKLIIDHNWKVL